MQADRAEAQSQVDLASGGEATSAPLGVAHLERCIRHIVYRDVTRSSGHEHGAARGHALVAPDAGTDVDLGEPGAGLDSLDMISAATAVSRFFDLGSTGLDDYLLFEETTAGWARLVARHFTSQGNDADLIFETSGSTDAPALVRKPLQDLQTEVDALIRNVLAVRPRRIVALAPPQHIFGCLFTVLLPSRLDVPVIDGCFRSPGSIGAQLAEGDLVVGTPFNWQMLMKSGTGFPDCVHGVTSGGPMPPPLWEDLLEAGVSGLIEVFGSTETGGLGWRSTPNAPFALLPHLFRGDGDIRVRERDIALEVQDIFEWMDETRFVPKGRIDRSVQIAGVNVSLSKVRDALCRSEHVSDAAVRVSEDRIKAFVVPTDKEVGHETLANKLASEMRDVLDPVACPVSYAFGPDLPRNEMGKLKDW